MRYTGGMKRQSVSLHAFTLVELSIVLVILGLLVGGVLAGQSLIHSAELRKTLTTIDNLKTAKHAFRDKYFALPGDMTNATQFWPDCVSVAPLNECNGDGNGRIGVTLGGSYEFARVYQQFSAAGLVEGSYDGILTHGLSAYGPTDKLFGFVSIRFFDDNFEGQWPDHKSVNFIQFQRSSGQSGDGGDHYWIDVKLDDGNGLRGNVRVYYDGIGSDECIDMATGEYYPGNPASIYCRTFVSYEN